MTGDASFGIKYYTGASGLLYVRSTPDPESIAAVMNELLIAYDMQQAYDAIWKFRKEVFRTWPTPDKKTSLKFAATESGEAIQMHRLIILATALHSCPTPELILGAAYSAVTYALDVELHENPRWSRNRVRISSVGHELLDCVVMLLTALEDPRDWNKVKELLITNYITYHGFNDTIEEIADKISHAALLLTRENSIAYSDMLLCIADALYLIYRRFKEGEFVIAIEDWINVTSLRIADSS